MTLFECDAVSLSLVMQDDCRKSDALGFCISKTDGQLKSRKYKAHKNLKGLIML